MNDMTDEFNSKLKDKLKEKIAEAGISVNALEKQAGLKRSAVHNILYDRSKKPSAEILYAVARVFGCSINELFHSIESKTRTTQEDVLNSAPDHESIPINMELYTRATQLAGELFKSKNINPQKQQALNYINEIYQYSLKNEMSNIDNCFAEWLIEKVMLHR